MPAQRIKPPTGAAEIIQELASKGYAQKGIAATFKISGPTLHRWFEDYPTIKQAYEIGKEQDGNYYTVPLRKQRRTAM